LNPILSLAEEVASRTVGVSGRLRRRLSEERKANMLLIDMKGFGYPPRFSRQITGALTIASFIFQLNTIFHLIAASCSLISSIEVKTRRQDTQPQAL